MYFPLNILQNTEIYPLFKKQLEGEPHIFNFSSSNPTTLQYDTRDFTEFQRLIIEELESENKSWGIGRYLEERKNILRNYPDIISEGRFYHLGLDIIVPAGLSLYAPIDGTVLQTGFEEGNGNYGGFIILEHNTSNTVYYSFYGHLDSNHLVRENQVVVAGEQIGIIGDNPDSGGWFTHTHLQIITEEARLRGMMQNGYISPINLPEVSKLFPDPHFLFRY